VTRRLPVVPILAALVLLATATPAAAETVRLSSSLRGDTVATSVAWSQAKFNDDTGSTAVLGRSDSFADSLAAGALAVQTNAPLLLNAPGDTLDQRVIDELDRLGSSLTDVRIVGGTAAVSQAVQDRLESLGYATERLAGTNRVETAVAVARDAGTEDGGRLYASSTEAYLARAFGDGTAAWADSLAGGVVAASHDGPLLVTETETLSTAVDAYLSAHATITTVYVLGGTAAVSTNVVHQLQAKGITVNRLAGDNRFGTAVAASDRSFDGGPGRITLVDGLTSTSWASGFAGGFRGGALLLVNGDDVPRETQDALHAYGERQDDDHWLYCAPEVHQKACDDAETLVNGGFVVGIG
jgi:putative cell wall-binding protein